VTDIATTGCRIRQTDLGVQICTYINVKNSYIDARLYRLAIQIDLATVVMDNLTGLQRIPINNGNKKSGKKTMGTVAHIENTIFENTERGRISDLRHYISCETGEFDLS
jgi:hypothetical protein